MISLSIAVAALVLAPHLSPPQSVFHVGGRTFKGYNANSKRGNCIIKGKWSDGSTFRYEAWDGCKKITMEWVPPKRRPEIVEQQLGRDHKYTVPAGSEGFRIGNEASIVWVFRDVRGKMQEILIGD